jgi:hypothetical protein
LITLVLLWTGASAAHVIWVSETCATMDRGTETFRIQLIDHCHFLALQAVRPFQGGGMNLRMGPFVHQANHVITGAVALALHNIFRLAVVFTVVGILLVSRRPPTQFGCS